MWLHQNLTRRELHDLIRANEITLAGNRRLKIVGTLHCTSGKKMKEENRVFFKTETEALSQGFRPCGHCMRDTYAKCAKNA